MLNKHKFKYLRAFAIKSAVMAVVLLSICLNSVKAHSVQVAYCVSCTGALRLYVEHWHNAENPATTTMTITTVINGVSTQQTAAPAGSLQNTLYGNLPGCATNAVSFASCSRMNTENDWVIYDFPGATPGSVVNITVVSGNSVFTKACVAGMYPATTGNFTIPNIVPPDPLPDLTMCGGVTSSAINFPFIANVTFTWTNDNPAIGLAASGTGNIPSFIPNIGTTPQVANIVIKDGCYENKFKITILPAPAPVNAEISASSAGTSCVYDSVFINGSGSTMIAPETITDYSWDFGDGTTSTKADNTHLYNAPGTYNIKLSVTGSNGCVNSLTNPFTVYPKPTASFTASTVCDGDPTVFNGSASTVDAPSTIANQIWEYGDGSQAIAINPSYTYTTPGTYTAQLIAVTDQNCLDTATSPVQMHNSPTAVATGSKFCLYDPLTFSSLGTTINSPSTIVGYSWNFGDGGSSTLENPNHLYSAVGTYNVTLTATSSEGCTDVDITTAEAYPIPSAQYTPTNVCRYDALAFDGSTSSVSSGSITDYSWKFGDGRGGSGISTTNLYAAPGTYSTELIVNTNQNCKDTLVKPVTIYPVPAADFTYTEPCFGTTSNFSSLPTTITSPGTITNYAWTFGDGNSSAIANPSNKYATAGTYPVKLNVTSADGCINETTKQPKVHPKPTADFNSIDKCTYDIFSFDGSTSTINNGGTITGYKWKFGDGKTGNGVSTSNLYSTDGTYTVELITISDNNCLDTAEAISTVFPVPVAEFEFDHECLNDTMRFDASKSSVNTPGSIVNYQWDFGGTTFNSALDSAKFLPQSTDAFTARLVVSTSKQCKDTTSKTAIVHPLPIASFTNDIACQKAQLTFTNTSTVASGSISSYYWDFGNNTSITTETPVVIYDTARVYNVKLVATSVNLCLDSITKTVDVKPKPNPNFESISPGECSPFCFTVSDSSSSVSSYITDYYWKFSNDETSTQQNPELCFTNEDNDIDDIFDLKPHLTITNNFGCVDSIFNKALIVSVFHNPLSSFGAVPPTSNMHDAEIQFENYSIGTDSYKWYFADGDSSSAYEPLHHYSDTGSYMVKLINYTNEGCTDSSDNPVRITPVIHFYIPNAFSPNGDGINDEFNWKGYGIKKENLEFYIFNRWGEVVFKTTSFTSWDGTVGGSRAQADVYVYKVYYQDSFGTMHALSGIVTLIR